MVTFVGKKKKKHRKALFKLRDQQDSRADRLLMHESSRKKPKTDLLAFMHCMLPGRRDLSLSLSSIFDFPLFGPPKSLACVEGDHSDWANPNYAPVLAKTRMHASSSPSDLLSMQFHKEFHIAGCMFKS